MEREKEKERKGKRGRGREERRGHTSFHLVNCLKQRREIGVWEGNEGGKGKRKREREKGKERKERRGGGEEEEEERRGGEEGGARVGWCGGAAVRPTCSSGGAIATPDRVKAPNQGPRWFK